MKKTEPWHRQHALHMASNFPTNIEDARIVLELLNELVEGFLAASEPETERASGVVRLKVVD
jgi:hypothetical protein